WTAGQRLLVVAELTRTITEMGLAILAEETPEMPDRDRYLAMLGSPETELRSYFYLALQAACFVRAQLDAGYRTPGRCPLSTNDLSPAARSDAIFAWDPNIEETATLGYTTSVREIGVSSRFQDLSDSRNLKLVTEVIVHETTHQLNFYTGRLAYGFLPTDLHYQNQIEPEPGDDSGRHVPGYGNAWLPYHNETTAQLAGAIFMSFQDIDDGWSFWGLSNYYIQYYYYPRLRGFAELLRAGQGTLARDAGTPYIARILSSTDPLRNLNDIQRSGCDGGDLNCYQRYLDESGIASMWRAQWELQFEVTGGIFRLWPPCLEYVDLNQRVARCSEAMLEAFYPNQHENEIESPETSDEHEPEGDPPDEDAEAWDAPERADRQASSEGEGESEPDLTICVLDIVMGITTESSAECVNWCWNAFPHLAPEDHWLCGNVQRADYREGCRYSDNGICEAEREADEAREEARRQAEAARRREAAKRRAEMRREAEEARRREEEAAEAAREAAWCSGEGSHYTLRYLDQAEDGCWPYIGPTRCCREGGRTHCEPEPGSTNKACGRDGWAGCWTDGREYYEYSRWPYDWYNDLRYGPGDDYEIQEGYHDCRFGMYEPGVCFCDCWILGNGIGGWCEYYND
ncbi:MAG: hypothetical protein HY539_04970, partial [Deltaproteobacteria bacterium]|nr:hypothetical protein [Deltaproteobacteria bacterium]